MLGAFIVCLSLAGSAAAEGQAWNWRETLTPHFAIKHQSTWLPSGFTMGAERVYFRLHMDMGVFSPWMAKEKINLFIYSDHESYLAGEFRPPAWSNGLAVYERKAVALPSMRDPRKLLSVMAHETTHLLFESFAQNCLRPNVRVLQVRTRVPFKRQRCFGVKNNIFPSSLL